jgi:hypothetical protein
VHVTSGCGSTHKSQEVGRPCQEDLLTSASGCARVRMNLVYVCAVPVCGCAMTVGAKSCDSRRQINLRTMAMKMMIRIVIEKIQHPPRRLPSHQVAQVAHSRTQHLRIFHATVKDTLTRDTGSVPPRQREPWRHAAHKADRRTK